MHDLKITMFTIYYQYVQLKPLHSLLYFHTSELKASLTSEPFAVCSLSSFIKDDHFLERLKDELLDQIFYEKNTDLYKFQQVGGRTIKMIILYMDISFQTLRIVCNLYKQLIKYYSYISLIKQYHRRARVIGYNVIIYYDI